MSPKSGNAKSEKSGKRKQSGRFGRQMNRPRHAPEEELPKEIPANPVGNNHQTSRRFGNENSKNPHNRLEQRKAYYDQKDLQEAKKRRSSANPGQGNTSTSS